MGALYATKLLFMQPATREKTRPEAAGANGECRKGYGLSRRTPAACKVLGLTFAQPRAGTRQAPAVGEPDAPLRRGA